MIPVRLELVNFLAYRTPEPLDLTGLHLACLAGANGAGKSSLLDAITWALWGKARSQRDDELIHGDELEMSVTLTFSLEGSLYRISRYRSRKGRGESHLVLEIADDDSWRHIGESTIRATQDKITRLLRLDYQTFINSAFLVQGRADEFTTRTPGERKAILGEILGLEAWNRYEDRAKAQIRHIDDQTSQIESNLEAIESELSREPEFQRELIQAQQDLEDLTAQVHEADIHVRELENARHERDSHRASYDQAQSRMAQAKSELDRIAGERNQHLERLAGFEAALSSREAIEDGFNILKDAQRVEREFADRLLDQRELFQQAAEMRQVIHHAELEAESEIKSLENRRADLMQIANEQPGADSLGEIESQIEALEEHETRRDSLREKLQLLGQQRAELEGQNRALKVEMDALDEQRKRITVTTESICPLCGQNLSDEHREELLSRLMRDGTDRGDQYRVNRAEVDARRAEEKELAQQIHEAEENLHRLPALREYRVRTSDRASRVQDAVARLEEIDLRLAEMETVRQKRGFLAEEQAALADVEARLEAIGYDDAAHQQARASMSEYEVYEAQKMELDRALAGAPEAEAAIIGLERQVTIWTVQRDESAESLDILALHIQELEKQLASLSEWEGKLDTLRDEEGDMRVRVGAAQQRLNALDQQRTRRLQLLADRDQLNEDRTIFEDLRLAFGRDGVPAMIIEAAIPEIEQEANQILSRMTDGRMHLRFDTQREKVTGGIKETLDIKIADEIGTRDYATFSGGEAFRVNFAVRLALSRLLARRAGAQLRTLIIDEGFGTQDSQGRERLIQAINAIQDEFDLILVITHIDELKEAFPARIEVTKTSDGAQIEVV